MNKLMILLIFIGTLNCSSNNDSDSLSNTYYISPTGSDSNAGKIDSPFATLKKLNAVLTAGDIAYIRGGTYRDDQKTGWPKWNLNRLNGLLGTEEDSIFIFNYPGERPIFDYTGKDMGVMTLVLLQMTNCQYVHIKGLTFTNAEQPKTSPIIGLNLTNSSHNLIDNFELSHIGGFGYMVSSSINGSEPIIANSEYNTFLNCDAIDCEDPSSPEAYGGANGFNIVHDRDDFGIHANIWGSHTTFKNCRAWNCSDDGWDLFGMESLDIIFENCWSMNNGYHIGSYIHTGDGNGFKLGPSYHNSWNTIHNITMTNCLAVGNYSSGFDQNTVGNTSVMWLYNCMAYANSWQGFYFEYLNGINHVFRNNLSYNQPSNIGMGTTHDHNSWDASPSVTITDADFISLDTSQLRGVRSKEGFLPRITFGILVKGSDLIDAGVDIGLPYNGTAPDIGAFEYGTINSAANKNRNKGRKATQNNGGK